MVAQLVKEPSTGELTEMNRANRCQKDIAYAGARGFVVGESDATSSIRLTSWKAKKAGRREMRCVRFAETV